jgi:rhodanese-related sulfurtransferase
MTELPLEVTVEEVRQNREGVILIDVREPDEFILASIAGAELVPMRTIPPRLMDFEDRPQPLVFFCHHGVRSLQVAAWLRDHGVENAQSMAGGIDAWSRLVDASVPRY